MNEVESFIIYKDMYIKLLDLEYEPIDYDLQVLIILNNITNKYMSKAFVNFEQMSYFIVGKYECSRTDKKKIEESMQRLNGTFIDILYSNKTIYHLNCSKLNDILNIENSKYYVTISIDKFSNLGKCGVELFKYYIMFCRQLYDKIYMSQSLENMSDMFSLDKKTVIKYNKILEEIKIIYIYKYYYVYANSNLRLNNMYGFYVNKETICEYAEQYIENNKSNIRKISETSKVGEYQPYIVDEIEYYKYIKRIDNDEEDIF